MVNENSPGVATPDAVPPAAPEPPPQLLYFADERQRQADAIEAVMAKNDCPMCGKKDWRPGLLKCLYSVDVHYEQPTQVTLDGALMGQLTSKVTFRQVPGLRAEDVLLPLECGGCGFTALFSATAIGALPREILKHNPAEGSSRRVPGT